MSPENIKKDERRRSIKLHKLSLMEKHNYILNKYKVLYKKGTRNIHCKDRG